MFNHIRLCYDVIVFIRTTIKKRGIGMSDFNQNNDDEDIVVTLDLDDGSQVECEILTIFTVGERDYIALLPLDENGEENEEGEVFIYRYSEDSEGNPSLDNIEHRVT